MTAVAMQRDTGYVWHIQWPNPYTVGAGNSGPSQGQEWLVIETIGGDE